MSLLHLVSDEILLLALTFIFKVFFAVSLEDQDYEIRDVVLGFFFKKIFLFSVILSITHCLCKFILVYIVLTLFDFPYSNSTQCTG